MLSGFVLTWTWRRDDGPRSFYLRRFARVYPVHLLTGLVAIAMGLLMPTVSLHHAAIPSNLALVQAWFRSFDVIYSLNLVSWSLSDEAFFYAVFPVVIGAVVMRPRSAAILVSVAAAYLIAVSVLARAAAPDFSAMLYTFPLYRIGDFLVGIGLALIMRRGMRLQLPVWLGLLLAVGSYCLLWPASVAFGAFRFDEEGIAGVLMIPAFSVAIMAAASRDADGRRGFLHRRFLVKLGQWSFALYMVHFFVLQAAQPLLSIVGTPLLRACFATAFVALALVLAAALYEWYERPIERRIRSWGNQRDSLIARSPNS